MSLEGYKKFLSNTLYIGKVQLNKLVSGKSQVVVVATTHLSIWTESEFTESCSNVISRNELLDYYNWQDIDEISEIQSNKTRTVLLKLYFSWIMLIGIDTYNYLHVWFTSISILLKPVQYHRTSRIFFTSSLNTLFGSVINCDFMRLMYFVELVLAMVAHYNYRSSYSHFYCHVKHIIYKCLMSC